MADAEWVLIAEEREEIGSESRGDVLVSTTYRLDIEGGVLYREITRTRTADLSTGYVVQNVAVSLEFVPSGAGGQS